MLVCWVQVKVICNTSYYVSDFWPRTPLTGSSWWNKANLIYIIYSFMPLGKSVCVLKWKCFTCLWPAAPGNLCCFTNMFSFCFLNDFKMIYSAWYSQGTLMSSCPCWMFCSSLHWFRSDDCGSLFAAVCREWK